MKSENLRRYIKDNYLMFLSREIEIKLCQIIRKFILNKSSKFKRIKFSKYAPIWKRLYPSGAWESQICSYYNFLFYFAFLIDIIDNIITYSPYSPCYVTRTSANGPNGNAVSLSRNTDGNHVTSSLEFT